MATARAPESGITVDPHRILYTIREACQALSISRQTFYREVRLGRLRTVPVASGRFRRVHRDELEAYGQRARAEADRGL